MSAIAIWRRRFLVLLGLIILAPVVATVTANTSSASGYSLATGINGEIICNPGGLEDCPE